MVLTVSRPFIFIIAQSEGAGHKKRYSGFSVLFQNGTSFFDRSEGPCNIITEALANAQTRGCSPLAPLTAVMNRRHGIHMRPEAWAHLVYIFAFTNPICLTL